MPDQPNPGPTSDITAAGAAATAPHPPIGPYHILSILGQGGMGIVYLAEQREPVRRRIALKVIKPGMDSEQVIRRFQAERQAGVIHQDVDLGEFRW